MNSLDHLRRLVTGDIEGTSAWLTQIRKAVFAVEIEVEQLLQKNSGGLTNAEALIMLKNMGHDTKCGTCMEQAFTGGVTGHPHTCGIKDDLIVEIF